MKTTLKRSSKKSKKKPSGKVFFSDLINLLGELSCKKLSNEFLSKGAIQLSIPPSLFNQLFKGLPAGHPLKKFRTQRAVDTGVHVFTGTFAGLNIRIFQGDEEDYFQLDLSFRVSSDLKIITPKTFSFE